MSQLDPNNNSDINNDPGPPYTAASDGVPGDTVIRRKGALTRFYGTGPLTASRVWKFGPLASEFWVEGDFVLLSLAAHTGAGFTVTVETIASAPLTTWGALIANGGLFWFNGTDFEPAIPGTGLQAGGGLGDWLLGGNPVAGGAAIGPLDGSDFPIGGLSAGSSTIVDTGVGGALDIQVEHVPFIVASASGASVNAPAGLAIGVGASSLVVTGEFNVNALTAVQFEVGGNRQWRGEAGGVQVQDGAGAGVGGVSIGAGLAAPALVAGTVILDASDGEVIRVAGVVGFHQTTAGVSVGALGATSTVVQAGSAGMGLESNGVIDFVATGEVSLSATRFDIEAPVLFDSEADIPDGTGSLGLPADTVDIAVRQVVTQTTPVVTQGAMRLIQPPTDPTVGRVCIVESSRSSTASFTVGDAVLKQGVNLDPGMASLWEWDSGAWLVVGVPTQDPIQGANLTDGASTSARAGLVTQYTLPTATLSADRANTLSTTGARKGDLLLVTRLDVTGFAYTVVGIQIFIMPGGAQNFAWFRFTGTGWQLISVGTAFAAPVSVQSGTATLTAGTVTVAMNVTAATRVTMSWKGNPATLTTQIVSPTRNVGAPGSVVFNGLVAALTVNVADNVSTFDWIAVG